jgi:hypothetical protein
MPTTLDTVETILTCAKEGCTAIKERNNKPVLFITENLKSENNVVYPYLTHIHIFTFTMYNNQMINKPYKVILEYGCYFCTHP